MGRRRTENPVVLKVDTSQAVKRGIKCKRDGRGRAREEHQLANEWIYRWFRRINLEERKQEIKSIKKD